MCRLSQDAIDDILRAGRIYEVGGAVRDRFLQAGTVVKDRDYLVTGIHYDALTSILKQYGRVDLVGRSFGVIKFTQFRQGNQYTFDIALPRREHSTGVGHKDFEVSFDPDIPVEDDLIRRDFTINAMALSLENEQLVDPLHGQVDLQNRTIRMTSPQSFVEDPLRMLRAVQFAARFNFMIEPETFRAIREHAELIKTVSAERIADELTKLLERAEKPSDGFRIMQTTGLLKHILPELEACVGVSQPGPYHKYDVFEHTLHVLDAAKPSLRLRLAALFHDIRKPQHRRVSDEGDRATFYGHEIGGAKSARDIMRRLRFSNDLTKEVSTLVERHMFTTAVSDKGLRRLVKKVGTDLIWDLLDLRRADVAGQGMGGRTEDVDQFESEIKSELAKKPPFGLGDLALSGNDIMTMFNILPSPPVGMVLNHLMERVLDNPEDNRREILEQYARDYFQKLIDGTVDSIHDKDSNE
ncbi:MAG: HDIG domain-containing protein [bacterium]|nr:HDIG domain-containing protein [bacterium]